MAPTSVPAASFKPGSSFPTSICQLDGTALTQAKSPALPLRKPPEELQDKAAQGLSKVQQATGVVSLPGTHKARPHSYKANKLPDESPAKGSSSRDPRSTKQLRAFRDLCPQQRLLILRPTEDICHSQAAQCRQTAGCADPKTSLILMQLPRAHLFPVKISSSY